MTHTFDSRIFLFSAWAKLGRDGQILQLASAESSVETKSNEFSILEWKVSFQHQVEY